jgi:hypothetical protein
MRIRDSKTDSETEGMNHSANLYFKWGIFDQPAKNDFFNRVEISDNLRRLRRYFREGQSIG